VNKIAKIILIIIGVLIFLSLLTDIVTASWLPTLAVLGAMAVAGFFTGINLLARGTEKPLSRTEDNSRKPEK